MKKIYLSILALGFTLGVSAQQEKMLVQKHDNGDDASITKPNKPSTINDKATVIWSDDFSSAATWTMTNTSLPTPENWTIQTSPSAIPNAAPSLFPLNTATASNGFALINSDGQPGNTDGDGAIIAEITNATPVDLSLFPNVILRFQHNYRWWHEERGVRLSPDNGTTWFEFPITSETGGAIANGYPNDQNTLNPEMEEINVSAAVGGGAQVLIQFYYNDNDFWGWYWAVDDVELIEQPANDIQVMSAWFSGSTNQGREYGRTPVTQLDAAYNVGAQILNFGTTDQTNIAVIAAYASAFTANATGPALLPQGDTAFVESLETPALPVGMYTGVYTATSTEEPSGGDFANNIYPRNFEVTSNLYSLDGIGNHPAATSNFGLIGTASFTGAQDGLVLAGMYDIKNTTDVSGMRIMLGSTTIAGGQIYGSIKDTATFWIDDMTPLFNIFDPVTVTAANIAAGYVDVLFPAVVSLTPGAYMLAAELYSNGGTNTISVVDDKTVPQPATASGIYIQGDASYTNGVAIGIRMLVNDAWGVGLNEVALKGISVYPNPSEGIINVDVTDNEGVTVTVYNMLGKEVTSKLVNGTTTIDLSANGAGMYIVKVSNENGAVVERVIIK